MTCALPHALQRLGFDPARLTFTLRTALAACLAVLLAWLAGLEHPQWSGMTVWAASLPVRGHLLEKSAFRALGTVVGAGVGVGLLLAFPEQPWGIILGLAAWISVCAGAGNLIRGFAGYGTMLAGYTAAMTALLHSAHSASPFAVGADRLLTMLLGVLVALLVGWMFAAPGDDDPGSRVAALTRRALRLLQARLAGVPPDDIAQATLLAEMSRCEEALDGFGAGSLRARQTVKMLRRTLAAQVGVLLWTRRDMATLPCPTLHQALQQALDADTPTARHAALRQASTQAPDAVLAEALAGLATPAAPHTSGPTFGRRTVSAWHRDWVGARQAGVRALCALLIVGTLWRVTGWEGGPFMLLGAAIMLTIFSTVDEPTTALRQVLLGQMAGVLGAMACRWLVWPLAGSEMALVLSMLPFILLGGVLFGHRRGAGPLGFDFNMVLLLLLQPAWPLTGSMGHSASIGAAVVLGPAVAMLAYRWIFPMSGQRRQATVLQMMVREVQAMAAQRGRHHPPAAWRARLYHRVLRLARWADKPGERSTQGLEQGFALLLAGTVATHLDDIQRHPATPARRGRQVAAVRARLQALGHAPDKAARALTRCATALADVPWADTQLLREAGRALAAVKPPPSRSPQ